MKKNGGTAFPAMGGTQGMTLRDYFAAKAMPIIIKQSHHKLPKPTTVEIAGICYEIADSMLMEREL